MIRDRLSHAIMETCLAMTIFQREFNAEFVVFFTLLAFIKVLHWLLQDRLEFLETTPHVSRRQHARIVAFLMFLLVRRRFASGCACSVVASCIHIWLSCAAA